MTARPCHLVDCHTHCFPDRIAGRAIANLEGVYRVRAASDGTLAGTLGYLEADQVDLCLVLPVASRPDQVRSINDWAASLPRDRVVAFGSIHPDLPDAAAEIDRLTSLGLRGIKLQPTWGGFYPDDPALDPIYRACAGRLIVYFHAGDEIQPVPLVRATPDRIARVMDRFPGLTVIAAHFGAYRMWDGVEQHLLGREVYFDTSYCPRRFLPDERMLHLIRAHGPQRILFGSDFPFGRASRDLRRLRRLGLSTQELNLICWQNAARLLSWQPNCRG